MSDAFNPTALRPDAPAMPTQGMEVFKSGMGLTTREYAAIALCIPDSGCDWLDAIIEKRRRDDFAAKASAAVISAIMPQECHRWTSDDFAREGYEIADAMLAASKKPIAG